MAKLLAPTQKHTQNKQHAATHTPAHPGEDSREDSLSAGCTDHISKPIQSTELFKILSRYMKSDHRG